MSRPLFTDVLAMPGVVEESELRSRLGVMAYHGGGLEETTDVVARLAAEAAGASYYGVVHPPGFDIHVPSTQVPPDATEALSAFFAHVDTVITVHGFGRRSLLTSILLGGRNRDLAAHLASHLRVHLPAYDVVDDLDRIPTELRGVHARNPVNLPAGGGVQIELPPRVRARARSGGIGSTASSRTPKPSSTVWPRRSVRCRSPPLRPAAPGGLLR